MIQSFDDYKEQAQRFQHTHGLMWASVGLAGETGEVLGEVKKWYEKDSQTLTNARREAIILELGDVLWFLNALCRELGVPLRTIAEKNIEKLTARYDERETQP